MITRKITNKFKSIYCAKASSGKNRKIDSPARLVVTTFYDVEGDYAIADMSKPCFRALEKIPSIEESLGIHSTYNVVAKFAAEAPALFRDLEKSGHEIASHSFDHNVLTDLDRKACRDNIFNARRQFDSMGLSVIGHRSPQSMWNLHVLRALHDAGFSWNAENGTQNMPYDLPVSLMSRNSLCRLPISIDDWAYEGSAAGPDNMLESWKACVNRKLVDGGYMAIGFHPWIEEPGERFDVFAEFMKWIAKHPEIQTMTFGEVSGRLVEM